MSEPAPFPILISHAEALAIIRTLGVGRATGTQDMSLARAHGHVLATDLVAGIAQPPFDNSAMDGYALRHADLAPVGTTRLRLVGEQFAGRAQALPVGPGECVRITTGAPLPDGADTVVIKENTHAEGDAVDVFVATYAGRNLRRAGEDCVPGDLLLRSGEVLTPARVALAASQGVPTLVVARRPTVAVFTTGDELVEPGLPLAPGQIHNSNRELLMGLLRADGLEPVAWPTLPDDPAQVESALRHAGHAFDLVLTCGAVSVGEKDHIPALLQAEARIAFWKVRMKPGMPVLLAEGGGLGDALFLCLPGNPVSVLATWLTLGRPLVEAMQGRTAPPAPWRARLASPWHKSHERLEFLRGRLGQGADGVPEVAPSPADGSHRMRAAADADVLLVLEEGARDYPAGAFVDVLPC